MAELKFSADSVSALFANITPEHGGIAIFRAGSPTYPAADFL
jgi:hypothetical protein